MQIHRIFKRLDCKYCAISISRYLNRTNLPLPNLPTFHVEYTPTPAGAEFYSVVLSYTDNFPPSNRLINYYWGKLNLQLSTLAATKAQLEFKNNELHTASTPIE